MIPDESALSPPLRTRQWRVLRRLSVAKEKNYACHRNSHVTKRADSVPLGGNVLTKYQGRELSKLFPFLPKANVANILRGYKDELNGTLCHN
jgi:hypothetical protein